MDEAITLEDEYELICHRHFGPNTNILIWKLSYNDAKRASDTILHSDDPEAVAKALGTKDLDRAKKVIGLMKTVWGITVNLTFRQRHYKEEGAV